MPRNQIFYLALLAVLAAFFVLYRGAFSLELLVLGLAVPVGAFFVTRRLKHALKPSVSHSRETARSGERFAWTLKLSNKSIFSTAYVLVTVCYENLLGGTGETHTFHIPLSARDTERVKISFRAHTCGTMRFRVEKMVIYDPLRLFHATWKKPLEDSVCVLPRPIQPPTEEWQNIPPGDTNPVEYAKDKPGDDPSEIFDLHTYHEGDSVSRIHWKLSSKLDELLVKEYSFPLSDNLVLLTDYRAVTEQPENSAFALNLMLCVCDDVMRTLVGADRVFVPAAPGGNGFQTGPDVLSLADAELWLRRLLAEPPRVFEDSGAHFRELFAFLDEETASRHVILFLPYAEKTRLFELADIRNPANLTVFFVSEESVPGLPYLTVALEPERGEDSDETREEAAS